tara:strand:+ start:244 stop:504 length:261 start_codon:yes stop_codon:yes gene_type:complete
MSNGSIDLSSQTISLHLDDASIDQDKNANTAGTKKEQFTFQDSMQQDQISQTIKSVTPKNTVKDLYIWSKQELNELTSISDCIKYL